MRKTVLAWLHFHPRWRCVLQPGTKKHSSYGNDGCEGIARCVSRHDTACHLGLHSSQDGSEMVCWQGSNPTNRTPCAPLPPAPAPPPSKFTDFPAECGSGDCSMNGTGPSKNTFHNNTQFDCGES